MKKLLPLAFLIGCTELGVVEESETAQAVDVCPSSWCLEDAPEGVGLLHSVWAASASDVFAVGNGGAIVRRTNGAWTAMTSGTTNNLRGVWGMSATDVWAVGANATILRFNGTSWSQVSGGTSTAQLDAVWGSGPNDVWLVGGGRALHWDGSAFTSIMFPGILLSVSGTGPNDVWVTGESSGLHHWTGSTWVPTTTGGGSTNFSVLALAINDVWVSTIAFNKESMHFTGGTKWAPKLTGNITFNAMDGLGANDVWGVGTTKIAHWTGTSWSMESPFGAPALWGVTTVPGHVWVVGEGGTIGHRTF